MFINLEKAKTRTRFSRKSILFNELIGYVDLTVFHEIWSQHSLINMEQKTVDEFLYFQYLLRGGLKHNRLREFFNSRN